ncbi:integrase, catalytic region, zinc finger, CCHC-type containing protein [Tanacetum coccineum]
MNVINMSMRPVQANIKFLKSLPPEWSKFMTDMKLARDLHTTNYDQLYSYLKQHVALANETRLMRERYQDPLAFVANYNQSPSQLNNYHSQYKSTQFPQQTNTMIPQVHSHHSYSPMYPPPHLSQPQISHSSVPPSEQYQSHMDHQTSSVPPIAYNSPQSSTQPMTEFPQMDPSLAVPVFNQGVDLISCLNKALAFLTAIASSMFPLTNNQLKTSSNPRNQTTIQDGRVTVQQVQGRQGQSYAGTSYKGNATNSGGNNARGQTWVVKCYNCQGEGHMARRYLKDNEITSDINIISYSQYLQETQQAAVQDTNLYAQQDSMILSVIEQMLEQMINHVNNWEKANQEKNNESLTAELEIYKERVKTFEQRLNIDLSTHEKND